MSVIAGPIFQVCWVVEDVAAAEEWFGAQLGITEWLRIPDVHFGPDHCRYRGEPADFTINVSMAYAGEQQLELIEPVRGESLYREFLDAHGPGIHHTAFVADDFAATVAAARAQGHEIAQEGSFPGVGMEFAYFAAGPLGTWIEIMGLSDRMRAMFDQIAARSSA
ncbi:VOC family protein [Nocardia stercoris]|uniref:VOC family protein n=1 Tax=Nocardia stercoris TaxID=2483361 RepID=A0A3M2LEC2_9NOCA|nr:VOC family protein [Nocardia stercoris]RMI35812.1 VOC family protein [Nocardia stercoris]